MQLTRYKTYDHEEKLAREVYFTIDHNGQWYFHGEQSPGPMKRAALVKLFADKALKYEEREFFLKTPFESYKVEVEDVPFLITSYEDEGNNIKLFSNIGDEVVLSKNKKTFLRKPDFSDIALPYIEIKKGLQGRLSPDVREALIHIALAQEEFKEGETLYLEVGEIKHPLAEWEG